MSQIASSLGACTAKLQSHSPRCSCCASGHAALVAMEHGREPSIAPPQPRRLTLKSVRQGVSVPGSLVDNVHLQRVSSKTQVLAATGPRSPRSALPTALITPNAQASCGSPSASGEQQKLLLCIICADVHPQAAMFTLAACGHSFCRACLEAYLRAKVSRRAACAHASLRSQDDRGDPPHQHHHHQPIYIHTHALTHP
jgi:hypothetical protein